MRNLEFAELSRTTSSSSSELSLFTRKTSGSDNGGTIFSRVRFKAVTVSWSIDTAGGSEVVVISHDLWPPARSHLLAAIDNSQLNRSQEIGGTGKTCHIILSRLSLAGRKPRISPALTHWGWDKMAAIFQTTFSNAFSWIKMFKFRLIFHWSLFPRVQLTIFQHWFR